MLCSQFPCVTFSPPISKWLGKPNLGLRVPGNLLISPPISQWLGKPNLALRVPGNLLISPPTSQWLGKPNLIFKSTHTHSVCTQPKHRFEELIFGHLKLKVLYVTHVSITHWKWTTAFHLMLSASMQYFYIPHCSVTAVPSTACYDLWTAHCIDADDW